MSSRKISGQVNKPLQEVFTYLVNPENLPHWGDGIIETTLLSDSPIGVGSTFRIKNKMGGRVQEFVSEVIDYEANHKYAFKTGSGIMGYTSTRNFEKSPGGTLITERIEGQYSGLSTLLVPLILGFIKSSHQKSLNRLKEILEK